MFRKNLNEKIKSVRSSVLAVGFSPTQGKMTITGSGFCISDDGKILTAAHIYNQVPSQFQSKLMGMAMSKQEQGGLEHYTWLPLELIKKRDEDDIALFQVSEYEKTLLKPLEFGTPEKIEVGQEVYFIGFPYAANLLNQGLGVTLIVNRGIISSVKRKSAPPRPLDWFIVDAISNPGNSGCPLIDVKSNKVIGTMSISFRKQSEKMKDLDIREPMHIAGAKPIGPAKDLL